MFGLSFFSSKCIINAVYFYSFSEIMQEKWEIKHYIRLFENGRIAGNSLFLKLQKKLIRLLKSLELKDKDIILAIS
jgi:hypothetical protein